MAIFVSMKINAIHIISAGVKYSSAGSTKKKFILISRSRILGVVGLIGDDE
jgi:hypothetical protein